MLPPLSGAPAHKLQIYTDGDKDRTTWSPLLAPHSSVFFFFFTYPLTQQNILQTNPFLDPLTKLQNILTTPPLNTSRNKKYLPKPSPPPPPPLYNSHTQPPSLALNPKWRNNSPRLRPRSTRPQPKPRTLLSPLDLVTAGERDVAVTVHGGAVGGARAPGADLEVPHGRPPRAGCSAAPHPEEPRIRARLLLCQPDPLSLLISISCFIYFHYYLDCSLDLFSLFIF